MRKEIAAQLYTVRKYTQTPEDLANTLKKVKNMGYDAVQLSKIGPIDPYYIKELLEREQLIACATHTSVERLLDNLQEVVDEHKLWGCKYVGLGYMPGEFQISRESYRLFAHKMSEIGKRLLDNGLQFVYHNHNFEFQRMEGSLGMDILLEESDPEAFHFLLDLYWVQAGGADPIEWIRKLKGKLEVVHFKDMCIQGGQQVIAEVGEGNLNWRGIIEACKETGVEWIAVEQDTCQRDPFDCLETSISNLKKLGL